MTPPRTHALWDGQQADNIQMARFVKPLVE